MTDDFGGNMDSAVGDPPGTGGGNDHFGSAHMDEQVEGRTESAVDAMDHFDGGVDGHNAAATGSDSAETSDSVGASDEMGNRRSHVERTHPKSTISVPPVKPGDMNLVGGDPVYFREGSTAIGYDSKTLSNFDKVAPIDGYHDVVVHGTDEGLLVPGRMNAAQNDISGPSKHPAQIAEAIRSNPSYTGGPIRLISCWTGTVGESVEE